MQESLIPIEKGIAPMQIKPIHINSKDEVPNNINNAALKFPTSRSAKYDDNNAAPHEEILDQNPNMPTWSYNWGKKLFFRSSQT
jgi:hypothetical protein